MNKSIFEQSFIIDEDPQNYIRHVNNLRYLEWFIQSAITHATKLGWGMQACKERGLAWVAQSHQIQYRAPAYNGDKVIIRTWIEKVSATRITRRYECKRDEKILAEGSSVWVMVDYEGEKPKAIPQDIKEGFEAIKQT